MASATGGITVDRRNLEAPGQQSTGGISSPTVARGGVTVDRRALEPPGEQSQASIFGVVSALGGITVDRRNLERPGNASQGYIDTAGAIWIPEIVLTGKRLLLMHSSGVEVPAGTWFLGPGGLKSSEEEAATPIPAGTLVEMHVSSNVDPGAGSYVITARKGTGSDPSSMADTANSVTLSSGERRDKSTTQVSYADQDWICWKIVSAGSAPAAVLNIAIEYDFD